jgi:transglutaminase-like putative cysteine protease
VEKFEPAAHHLPMNFRVTCELDYTLQDTATFLFAIQCLKAGGQQILKESLFTEPGLFVEEFGIGGGMNRFSRIRATVPGALKVFYQADVSTTARVVPVGGLRTDGPDSLSPAAIPFLFPSRYCQSDRLRQQAQNLFGHLNTAHAVAAAVSDWIFANIAYVGGSSGETCSAMDTFERREGVCRDFAHLGIAFCRVLNVPARYATYYAYQLSSPDFHACFEAFIGGEWFVFDATRHAPLNGLVRIATGRDAADAAVCTIFGNPELTRSSVSCECLDGGFIPVTRESLAARDEAIVLD